MLKHVTLEEAFQEFERSNFGYQVYYRLRRFILPIAVVTLLTLSFSSAKELIIVLAFLLLAFLGLVDGNQARGLRFYLVERPNGEKDYFLVIDHKCFAQFRGERLQFLLNSPEIPLETLSEEQWQIIRDG